MSMISEIQGMKVGIRPGCDRLTDVQVRDSNFFEVGMNTSIESEQISSESKHDKVKVKDKKRVVGQ